MPRPRCPAQPGAVPPPSQWGSAAPRQHPAWGGGGAPVARPGAGAMGAGGPAGAPPCADEFMPLRNDAQNKGMAIKAAIDRKAERAELCKVFRTFVAAEAKVVKFVAGQRRALFGAGRGREGDEGQSRQVDRP